MAFRYLDKDGALSFWTNIKNYILSKIPTKTSELTNDSGFLTQHQSLSNYVTIDTAQDIEGNKNFKGLLTTIPNDTIWPVTASTTDDITYLGANAIHVEQKSSGKLTDLSGGAWSVAELGLGCFFFRINNGTDIRYKNFAQNTVNRIPVVSGANRFINDVTPNADNTYNLGSNDLKWDIGYIHNLIGSNKENASEDANNYYSTTSGSHMTFYTTTNGGTKLSNVPAAVNTQLESRTIRYLSSSDWIIEQICHNSFGLYYRKGTNGTWEDWKTFAFTNSNITGKASNVTGTVAIANGGTGATTRLNAVKALTNESVGTPTHFLAITTNWGKAGYTTIAQAKTVLGITGDIVSHNASEFLTQHPSITLSTNTTSTASPAHGGTFTCIDSVTQDTNGHITKVNTKTVTLPSDNNTDTLMTQNVSTTNSTYPILLCPTANATSNQGAKTGIFAKSVKVNPSTNVVSASGFSGPLTGNVTGNCSGSSGSCTGNAATATQFSANTTVALTGDATGTSAGSKKGWSVPVTLANSGVTAGTYGPSADVTGNNNATISVPEITVDAKGRVTSVTNRTYTSVNTDTNTDTKVTQTVTTANSNYPVLLCTTANATETGTTTSRFSAGLTVNTRYSSISMTNKYDTANTKGVRDSTKGYLNGDIIFKCYDDSEMGRIHCESSKNGYQQTYMQARSYIKNGAISPEGTATTCYITVRVRDNGSKTIYTDGSWENSLTPYINETYDLGTSSLRWMRCYCKNFYGSYVDIAGRYIGNEYSTNASTCLYLKSKRDTDGKSGIYFSKFRQNRAQGALTGSDLVDLSLDVLENSVRTNSCISISFRYFENDVPTKIYVIPKASATSYMGTADNPWTNAYITNLILNGNVFDPTSTSGNIGDIVFARAYYSAINNLTMTAGGNALALIRIENGNYVQDRNNQSFSGTWKFLGSVITVTSSNADSTCAGVWKRIA